MSKHSGGKWEIRTFTNLARNEDSLHVTAGKRMVAKVMNHPGECSSLYEHISDEDRANARIIASAPELLEALKRIISSAPITGLPLALEKDIQSACAIIAKAEGQDAA